jgi:hypothetical protein
MLIIHDHLSVSYTTWHYFTHALREFFHMRVIPKLFKYFIVVLEDRCQVSPLPSTIVRTLSANDKLGTLQDAGIAGSNFVKNSNPNPRCSDSYYQKASIIGISCDKTQKAVAAHLELESALDVSLRRSSTSKAEFERDGSSR